MLISAQDCNYVFEWATSAACPVQSVVGSNCKVTDPDTGYVYDFSNLIATQTDYTYVSVLFHISLIAL